MRGQTTLDFTIGVAVFLAVLVFIFSFVPGIYQPFTDIGEEDSVTVSTISDRLAGDILNHPAEPNVLDRHCTVAFFDDEPPPDECRFDGDELHERLSIPETKNVNVSIQGDVDDSVDGATILCWDDNDFAFNQRGAGDCDTEDVVLADGGEPIADHDARVTSTRTVALEESDVTIRVVVW